MLGRLPFLPLLFLPPPAPGPMLIKTLMFVRVIVLLYPNIEQGGRGIFSKRENSLFSGLKWTAVKLHVQPSQLLLSVIVGHPISHNLLYYMAASARDFPPWSRK